MHRSQIQEAFVDRSTRFLISRAAGAAITGVSLRPIGRFSPLAPFEFAVGVPTSEMPLHVGALRGALALLGARHGGLRGWRGAAGVALAGASAAGLWRLHRLGQESETVLEQALARGLGDDYRSRITEPFTPAPHASITRRALLLPGFARRSRYTNELGRDLSYGDAGPRNTLDIWKRTDLSDDAGAPVLVQVHGGAWTVGEKVGQAHPLMSHLADRGWVCVAINYRLSPRATWPDHIVDVKRALAWTKANIGSHGGDPSFVAITGGSAGGHLTALAALTPNVPEFQPGFEEADTSVAAAVPFYGVYDFTNRNRDAHPLLERLLSDRVLKTVFADDQENWHLASPMSHVQADAPPFFLLHGTNDTLVPIEQGRAFAGALADASRQPVVFAELPGAQHAFDISPSVRAHHTVRAVERFLAVVRSEHGGATPAEAVSADLA